jgi:hypothetical protein
MGSIKASPATKGWWGFSFPAFGLAKRPHRLIFLAHDSASSVSGDVFGFVIHRNDFAGAIAESVPINAGDYTSLTIS